MDDQQLKSFSFFRSYYEAGRELEDKERLAFYDAIIKHCFDGLEPSVNGTVKAMFLLCKPNISRRISRAKAGENGGMANGKQTPSNDEANRKQTASKPQATTKQNASKEGGEQSACRGFRLIQG
ncbi:MAG: DUF6291 domain-containing protein [Clostridium sp.]|nr:DUF6291 domain-containing protein [Clostridium sp.]